MIAQRKLPLILFVLSGIIHLAWLSHPRSVVFDEVHFGKFVTSYCCTGQRFFDIHPPHAKLLIAGVARLAGYKGGMTFEQIGQPYGDISPVSLRLLPALVGTFLPVVFFIFLRQLGASSIAAFFGGLLITFDNALTLQTRIIVLDGVLLLATFASLSLFFAASKMPSTRARSITNFFAGCLAGLAVGTKFTGLVAIGLLGLLVLVRVMHERTWPSFKQWLQQSLWILLGAIIVYGGGWALHFSLLTQPGSGDVWGLPSGHLIADIIDIHRKMLTANFNLEATHPDASPWWSWPLMKKPIFYWVAPGSAIYFLGNPIVWWLGSLLFIVVLVNLALFRVTDLKMGPRVQRPVFWLPIVGYFMAIIPLTGVPRVLFMYHYLTPLLFSLVVVVLWLDYAGWIRPQGARQRWSFYAAVGLLILGFVVISPLTFGLKISPTYMHFLVNTFIVPH